MTVLNRRLYDNVVTFVDGLSGANVIGVDVTKPDGTITLAISGNVAGNNLKIGSGSPEGTVAAKIGSMYQRTDGSSGTSLYIKEAGSGTTGWTALSALTSAGSGSLNSTLYWKKFSLAYDQFNGSHVVTKVIAGPVLGPYESIDHACVVVNIPMVGAGLDSIFLTAGFSPGGGSAAAGINGATVVHDPGVMKMKNSIGENDFFTTSGPKQIYWEIQGDNYLDTLTAGQFDVYYLINKLNASGINGGSGGTSLSGGIANRVAVWSATDSVSASHIITEGKDELTIRGTTVMTTAKGTGETWNALKISDGMSGGANDTGTYPGSRILYESDSSAPNPYRASIDFSAEEAGMDAKSRMTLSTQNSYYEPLVPGVTIIGGREDQFGSSVIIKSPDRIDLRSDAFQVSGNSYFSNTVTTKGAYQSYLPLGSDTALEVAALDATGTSYNQGRLHYYRSDSVATNFANTITLNTATTATRIMFTTQPNALTAIPNAVFTQGARSLFGTFADNGVDTVQVSGTMSSFNLKRGTGSPEGAISGAVGTIFQRTNGSAGTTLYVKESGTGNTGWTAISAASTGSVSGVGIATRAAIWGSTNSLSASSKIFETDTGVMISGGFSSPFINPVRNNEIIGLGAGNISMVGTNNVFIGRSVGSSASTSNNNVAIGSNALANGALADDNIAIGRLAMFLYRGNGGSNVAIGSSALQSLTTGTGNIAIGVNAGVNLTTDFNNILLGGYVDSGNSNIAIGGGQAGVGAGSNNLYFGIGAGPNGLTGEVTDYANNLWLGGYTTTNRIKRVFFNGNVSAIPMGIELYAAGGSGVNISGSDFTIHGGRASGAAQGGRILLKVGTPGSTASDINPYQTALVVTSGANILVGTTVDNGDDRLQVSGTAGISGNLVSFNIRRGSGSPEGVVSAVVGSIYQRVDGSTGTTLYVKESGTGNTGWTAVAITVASTGKVNGAGTGSANFIPYWLDDTTIGSHMNLRTSTYHTRILVGSSVTDDTSSILQVQGNTTFDGYNSFRSTSASTPIDIGTGSSGRRLRMYHDGANNRNVIDSLSNGGNTTALHITPNATPQVIIGSSQNISAYRFQVTGKTYISTTLSVGSTADNGVDRLQVAGSASISGSLTLTAGNFVNYTNSIVTITGNQFTFDQNSHGGRTIEFTSPIDVLAIVPSNLPKGFGCDIIQAGTGSVYVSAGPSATLINKDGYFRTYGLNAVSKLSVTANTNGSSATARFFGDVRGYLGTTWERGYAYAPGANWQGVAYGSVPNRFVGVLSSASLGLSGSVLSSEDGFTWTGRSAAVSSGGWSAVTYGNGKFVAVASTGAGTRSMYSTDGITWTPASTGVGQQAWSSVGFGNGRFVSLTTNTQAMWSSDGISWNTSSVVPAAGNWVSVAYGNNKFVAVSSGSPGTRISTSPDGDVWTSVVSVPATASWAGIAYGAGLFVVVNGSNTDQGKTIMTSPDGDNWTLRGPIPAGTWKSIAYGVDTFGISRFVATQAGALALPRAMTSTDGINWTPVAGLPDGVTYNSTTFGQNKFVTVGNANNSGEPILVST